MRFEFAAKMRMAGEAAALCDFADGNLRLQEQSLRLLGPQPSQIRAHGNSVEATEFPRKMNLVTSCLSRDLHHGERHKRVLMHKLACRAKPSGRLDIDRGCSPFSAECGDNFQHNSFASDRRETIILAHLFEQPVAQIAKGSRVGVRRVVQSSLAVRKIVEPAIVGLEDNLPNARCTEFLGMRGCRGTKRGRSPGISPLVPANAFQKIAAYNDIHRGFVVLVRGHFSMRLVTGNSKASLGEHGWLQCLS
jgi:hypothetical protein